MDKKLIDFPDKRHNKHVTGEVYFLIGTDRYTKKPIVLLCKSTESKDVIKFQEMSIDTGLVLPCPNIIMSFNKMKRSK